jgi:GTP-binding protein YchF
VGKSTLFNALTNASAEVGSYPFTTVDSNVGVVHVPDVRLDRVAQVAGSARAYATTLRFVDIAGLVKGASKGEGLGNRFLGHIREVDAIVHVVRCFLADTVCHVEPVLDPLRDTETIMVEMALADLETLDRRAEKTLRTMKAGDPEAKREMALLERLKETVERGITPRLLELSPGEASVLQQLFLLTAKPMVYVGNISEAEVSSPTLNPFYQALAERAIREGAEVVAISAKIEAEIQELPPEEAKAFLEDMGFDESGANRLIRTCYQALDLITFFTANSKEARAWTVPRGTTAQRAAGKVHSDMEKGFVRAEVVPAEVLRGVPSYGQARDQGLIKLEGRDYVVQDGDLMLFRFTSGMPEPRG